MCILVGGNPKDRHYANSSMHYSDMFEGCKDANFKMKNCDSFRIFAQNVDCWYT